MPPSTDHDARRRAIAHAVWATVSEHGIEGTTMRRVAAAGSISVGRIQHYFPSREEMLRFSCRAMVDLAATTSAPAGDASSAPTGSAAELGGSWDQVRTLLGRSFDQSTPFRLGARVWAAFVAHSVVDAHIADVVVQAQTGLEDEVARLLGHAGHDPEGARHLVALADGLALRTLTGALTTDEAVRELDLALARA
ncbi:TetR/AcrR family transcriptional regulator [uncultured Pseudokineococcus sp.]|uniref:TetR/AcrR family transcriptional regulator n=1 Tax=uncultured Pseudokineococcus sp. TaxID=1642928 RepID=UPI002632F13A|nr:TetR/AcrR family transcriptional regulator [uncultured Pseudokineococcus sp.]